MIWSTKYPARFFVRDIFIFSCYTGLAYIDIYNLRRRIEKGRLLNKLKENNRGEEIYLFAFFNLVGLMAFFISLKKKGVLPGQHPFLKNQLLIVFLSQ